MANVILGDHRASLSHEIDEMQGKVLGQVGVLVAGHRFHCAGGDLGGRRTGAGWSGW